MKASDYIANLLDNNYENFWLFKTGLGLALIEHDNIQFDIELQKLEALVEAVRSRVTPSNTPDEIFQVLTSYYFKDLDVRGNFDNYYETKNSFLHEVLERAKGIPISISVIFIEIAKQLGLDVYGINFPGHFLIGYNSNQGEIYLDPFHGGKQISIDNMKQILDQLYDGNLSFQKSFLTPASNLEILIRMLNNLRGIYLDQKNYRYLLEVLDCILLLMPNRGTEYKNRGLLHLQVENFQLAEEDLLRYLELVPSSEDSTQIEKLLIAIKEKISQ